MAPTAETASFLEASACEREAWTISSASSSAAVTRLPAARSASAIRSRARPLSLLAQLRRGAFGGGHDVRDPGRRSAQRIVTSVARVSGRRRLSVHPANGRPPGRVAAHDPPRAGGGSVMAEKVGNMSLRTDRLSVMIWPWKGLQAPRQVAIVLFADVQSLDVTGPLEVFTGAARLIGRRRSSRPWL